MRAQIFLRVRLAGLVLLLWAGSGLYEAAHAREEADSTDGSEGWEFAGVPALSYDADEGFGYGVLLELYYYGQGNVEPYELTVQPQIIRSTGGRRDYTVFFDAPEWLADGWRTIAYAGYERQMTSPYYGPGNEASYRPSAAEGENPYYYRFGLLRRRATLGMQRSVGELPLRVVGGLQTSYVSITPVPKGEGTTLLAQHLIQRNRRTAGWSNSVQVGLVWDTRNRETGPRDGLWSELLARRVDKRLGSVDSYTRLTATDRRYLSVVSNLTFAHRVLLQQVFGDAPFYDLYVVESSYQQQNGLGGADTIRGVLKNRYVGKGMFIWNAELRWRAFDFEVLNRSFYVVASGFVDSGRVWKDRVDPAELLADLHHGVGGGVRLGMGENFVIALDIGYGAEAGMRIYTSTGYLF